jgi:tetrahydromethanopterin S-methyltransferase subunit F
MAWVGICNDGRTQIKIVQGTLNTVKYRDDILDTNQSLDKGLWDVVPLVHKCVTQLP